MRGVVLGMCLLVLAGCQQEVRFDPNDYDLSCQADDEQPEGSCGSVFAIYCSSGCAVMAIDDSQLGEFEADLASATADCDDNSSLRSLSCQPPVQPRCIDGQCTLARDDSDEDVGPFFEE